MTLSNLQTIWGRILFGLFLAIMGPIGSAAAYQVAPLHHYLDLTGKNATSFLTIDNTHDYPLTVELSIQRRILKDGMLQEDIPADDDFLIFPPQAIVQPGKKQRVQIRYVGDTLDQSQLYRLVVAQVPVKLSDGDSAKIDIAYNFISAVYVAPKSAKADLSVDNIRPSATGGYDVLVKNTGSYHALLPSFTWTASDGQKTSDIDAKKLTGIAKVPFIEPNGARTVNLPREALGDLNSLASVSITEPKKTG